MFCRLVLKEERQPSQYKFFQTVLTTGSLPKFLSVIEYCVLFTHMTVLSFALNQCSFKLFEKLVKEQLVYVTLKISGFETALYVSMCKSYYDTYGLGLKHPG